MSTRHEVIEKNVLLLAVLTLITVSIGGMVQIIPLFTLVDLLRAAGCRAHVTILGSLEDQVSFIRYLRQPDHPHYARLFALVDSVIVYEADEPLVELSNAQGRIVGTDGGRRGRVTGTFFHAIAQKDTG